MPRRPSAGLLHLRRLGFGAGRGEGRAGVALFRSKETLGVEGGHTAAACGGYRLPVDVVLHVSRGKDARYVRLARLRVAEPDAADRLVPEHLVHGVRRLELDLVVVARAVDHDLRGAELVSAMD